MGLQRMFWLSVWTCIALANVCRGDDATTPREPAEQASDPLLTCDAVLKEYFRNHDVELTDVSDRTFIRRASLDLVGLLPTPDEAEAFATDRDSEKRSKLVDRLLADREAYATHWLTFWSDALRNAYRGTGFIDNGRSQITGWLFASLYENKPYDRFVHELISPVPGSEGFARGIKWRGVVNESQRPEVQAAQNIAQVFLGTNLKCASCHDSFVNDWKLADAYRLASVFAEQPLEIHHCDQPTGKLSEVGFIYPELGPIDGTAAREDRMHQLADLVVQRENRRFARTIVNRLWAQLMGRGLVEPRDNLDSPAFSEELLDWLADDFVAHGYDLQHTLRRIATSRAYQMAAVNGAGGDEKEFSFRGPLVKRMTAEQYVDAVAKLVGIWPQPEESGYKRDGRGQMGQLAAVATALAAELPDAARLPPLSPDAASKVLADAAWIWTDETAFLTTSSQEAYFRTSIPRGIDAGRLVALLAADSEWELFVEGISIAAGRDWHRPALIELTPYLKRKQTTLGVRRVKHDGKAPFTAGLVAVVIAFDADGGTTVVSATGGDWKSAVTADRNWQRPAFKDTHWPAAYVVANATSGPWNLTENLAGDSLDWTVDPRTVWQDRPVRAALLVGDTLQSALGRPNREQTVTSREPLGTLLQALELTNGTTLDVLLQQGAERLMTWQGEDAAVDGPIGHLFLTALGRSPSDPEQALARDLVGSPPTAEGYADLLWTIVMLPEFQLVY